MIRFLFSVDCVSAPICYTSFVHISLLVFNERKLVLGLALVMLCYVSEPEKVSKLYGCAKVGLNDLILLDEGNILSNIVRYLLILSDID